MFFTLLSRIPFLFDGYGSEEDAWALALVADRIATTGHYEVSRLPGHPVQEIVFALLNSWGPIVFNLTTALISTTGVWAFYRIVRTMNRPVALWSGIALASTPIVFIHSTNAMDYTWGMSLLLCATLALISNRILMCGILIGLATGCRITSLGILAPMIAYVFYLDSTSTGIRSAVKLLCCTLASALAVYIPVLSEYGTSFFTFYEHFPIPHWTKNLYKGTLGVWGLPALVALIVASIIQATQLRRNWGNLQREQKAFAGLSAGMVILMTIVFFRLPLKSAFLVPAVPFAIALAGYFFSRKQFYVLTGSLLAGCFVMGVNLAEAHRGSVISSLAVECTIADHRVALDPLYGLVTADRSKRIQRTAFAESVVEQCKSIGRPTALVCGWWLADILVLSKQQPANPNVLYEHYISPAELDSLKTANINVYYLEDQAEYNDLRFDSAFTKNNALPFTVLLQTPADSNAITFSLH